MNIKSPSPIVNAVECLRCKTLHRSDSESFYSIHGNICIGMDGGIVGNNLNQDGTVGCSVFCIACLVPFLTKHDKTLVTIRDSQFNPKLK